MYNQQSFHTANYRGNVQGHDQSLRADSQQPSSFAAGSFNTPVSSQYKGFQRSFQPTGYVQSVYGQNGQQQQLRQFAPQQQQFGLQQQLSQQQPQYGAQQSQSAFHTANYRGNQQGHDQYLRADSQQPNNFQNQTLSQNQFQPAQTSTQFASSSSLQNTQFQPAQQQFQNQIGQQQFHAANYQGNQQGHDQYLRADSQQPTQFARNSF